MPTCRAIVWSQVVSTAPYLIPLAQVLQMNRVDCYQIFFGGGMGGVDGPSCNYVVMDSVRSVASIHTHRLAYILLRQRPSLPTSQKASTPFFSPRASDVTVNLVIQCHRHKAVHVISVSFINVTSTETAYRKRVPPSTVQRPIPQRQKTTTCGFVLSHVYFISCPVQYSCPVH